MKKKGIQMTESMENINKKNNNGITLIALVITIIVLLILAGVTISMLSGENGILIQATKAKTDIDDEAMKTSIHLAYLSSLSSGNGKINYDVLNSELARIGFDRGNQAEDGTYPNDITSLPAIIEIEGEKYTITNNGKIEKIGIWSYKEDSQGRKTIVTNGVLELKIGDYINYNAVAIDANEENIKEETITSNAGTPTETKFYKAEEKIVTEGNGASNQTFSNKATTNGWRVLGVDETTGEILIISADPVKTTGNANFNLRGIAGYNYGEKELDKVCSVFGKGYGATGARSVDVDDVNKITGYNPKNTGKYDPEQTGSETKFCAKLIYEYGNEATYNWTETEDQISYLGKNNAKGSVLESDYGTYGFNWYDEETKTWKNSMRSDDSTFPAEIVTLTSTRYYYYPNTLTESSSETEVGIKTTSPEYLTLFCNKAGAKISYWLASPYVHTGSGYAHFGLQIVDSNGFVYSSNLYISHGYPYNPSYGVRPVVSLRSDIKLQYDKTKTCYDIIE